MIKGLGEQIPSSDHAENSSLSGAVEGTLGANDARYRECFEALDAGFCIFQMCFEGSKPVDFKFLEVNRAFERQTGLKDPVGRQIKELVPAYEQHWLNIYGHVAQTGEPVRLEDRSEALGRWYDIHAFRIGSLGDWQVAVLFNDITARRAVELQAAANARELRLVTDALPVLIAFVDASGIYRFANDAYEHWFFLPADQVIGRHVMDVLGPEKYAKRRYFIERALAGEEIRSEVVWPREDGSHREAEVRYLPRRGDDGAIEGFHTFVQDITDLKQAHRRQAILLSLSDRLRSLTDPGEITHASCEILGTALKVSIVGYGVVDKAAETIAIERDWTAPGIKTLAGVLNFREYGSYIDELKQGLTVIIGDTKTDPRTQATAESLKGIGVQSFINMPLLEHDDMVALFYVAYHQPRIWNSDDLALVREVADRTRAAAERARTEAALRESEEQFRVFAQAVPNQIWASRPDGYLYWFNEQFYAYCGAQPGSLDGRNRWAAIIHPDDYAEAAQAWAHSLTSGTIYENEFRIRDAAGDFRWFLARAEPVRDATGAIVNWVGTNTDIDDRKRQATELANLNATLEQQVEQRTKDRDRIWRFSTDVMLVAKFDATMLAVNPAWTRLFGWSEAELIGRSFMDFVHPDDAASTTTAAAALASGAAIPRFENRYRHKDGSYRWLTWTAVADDQLIHAIGRDYTAEQEANAVREKLEDQLRQSQKMEAVGQLTGGLAHDFNNMLAGVVGSLELMQTRLLQGRIDDLSRYIGAAQVAAERAAALTHRLLAFSRRQTLAPKPTDVNRLVTSLEELIRRTVGPAIEINVVAADQLWPTLVDPSQLENALLNLCLNARDAMPDGGKIIIETGNCAFGAAAARQDELEPGDYVSLTVKDNGTGMPPDVIAKAFEPFFTTKPLGQGTGLGLSMIYGFVRQSGGQVQIESKIGDGTRVRLYLPRHRAAAVLASTAASTHGVARAKDGETVLVVDDEPTVRMLVTEVLEDLGYAAIEAFDGASGMKVLHSDIRIDLLVTDVGLPGGLNGRQMVDAARLHRPDLRVLFITGYAENAALNHGHLSAGMQVMTKPFSMEALAERIRSMIEGNLAPDL